MPVSASRVRELFDYDRDSGLFTRKIRTANVTKVGEVAGRINDKGYVVIKVDSIAYKAHRLAWLWWYGEWPESQIDHIDGNKQNNSIWNLRVVNFSENRQNTIKPHKNNKLGIRGVKFDARPGRVKRYESSIKLNGKEFYLGSFHTAEEAYQAYLSAKIRLHIRGVV